MTGGAYFPLVCALVILLLLLLLLHNTFLYRKHLILKKTPDLSLERSKKKLAMDLGDLMELTKENSSANYLNKYNKIEYKSAVLVW